MAHRSQENILLTRLLFYYKRTQLRNKQMPKSKDCGKVTSCHALHHSPSTSMWSPTWKISKVLLLAFYGGITTQAWLIDHWLLVTKLNLQHPPFPRGVGGWVEGFKVLILSSCGWFPWQPAPIFRGLSQSYLINRMKGLLWWSSD